MIMCYVMCYVYVSCFALCLLDQQFAFKAGTIYRQTEQINVVVVALI